MDSFHIWYKWSLAWVGVSHVITFDLDLYFQGHSTLFWLGTQHDSIVWVIMRRRGVSSERRHSSCSSYVMIPPVCSVATTVADGFFPYLAQMVTSMRWWCVILALTYIFIAFGHDFAIETAKIFHILSCLHCKIWTLVLDGFFHMSHKYSLAWRDVFHMTVDCGLYLQRHSAIT